MADNRWVRSSGSLNEQPISIQHREEWEALKATQEYGVCVQIAWNARSLDEETGFPSLGEQIEILALGEQLQQLENSKNSVLTMIITHGGVNQWVIYVKDLELFKTELASIAEPTEGYPIELVADEDAKWNTFTQVYQRIVELA